LYHDGAQKGSEGEWQGKSEERMGKLQNAQFAWEKCGKELHFSIGSYAKCVHERTPAPGSLAVRASQNYRRMLCTPLATLDQR
jgi:hypothetical protein